MLVDFQTCDKVCKVLAEEEKKMNAQQENDDKDGKIIESSGSSPKSVSAASNDGTVRPTSFIIHDISSFHFFFVIIWCGHLLMFI